MSDTTSTSTLAVPIFEAYTTSTYLPPTPISSSSSIINTKKVVRELSTQNYGSLSSTPYLESRPVTPSQTTISPDDDDESLYLLWTKQLLKERGIGSDEEEKEDDDDSSVSDMSSTEEEEEEDDDDDHAAQVVKQLVSLPSYAYSHRDSIDSRASFMTTATERISELQQQNPISLFFHQCFSSCL
ncbi:hypothetical protein BD770DRAFT_379646 [Pilaira anomala]|nr:hypothetical protein BD770DRAFT_379646 [Pilaira anomala]